MSAAGKSRLLRVTNGLALNLVTVLGLIIFSPIWIVMGVAALCTLCVCFVLETIMFGGARG